jgi:hypothetical protein
MYIADTYDVEITAGLEMGGFEVRATGYPDFKTALRVAADLCEILDAEYREDFQLTIKQR